MFYLEEKIIKESGVGSQTLFIFLISEIAMWEIERVEFKGVKKLKQSHTIKTLTSEYTLPSAKKSHMYLIFLLLERMTPRICVKSVTAKN